MIGHCAKKVVTCEIITVDGKLYVGSNYCLSAQEVCPRKDGEGYEKCKSICQQVYHAEVDALTLAKASGANVKGATAIIRGIGYSCRNCQEELYSAGIKYISCVV